MPLGDAQGDSLVQLIFAELSRRGIHRTNQLATVTGLFIKQGRGMLRIEPQFSFQRIAVISEVIHRLGQVRHEDLETRSDGCLIVLIFIEQLARYLDDFGGKIARQLLDKYQDYKTAIAAGFEIFMPNLKISKPAAMAVL